VTSGGRPVVERVIACPRCHQHAPAEARFCTECGAKLAITCPACRTSNAPFHRFCNTCGTPLAITAPDLPRVSPRLVPVHLVEKILKVPPPPEGERKQVTVLFADIKGSLELLADRDPEEWRAVLDSVLERIVDAVHQYEGTVNQMLGDGLMALFGAPLAHENHAIRACYAALRMHQRVAEYADAIRSKAGLDVQIRVGLNSGEVVWRSIRNDLSLDYSAVGETTHLAARMEQLARPGSTLLTGYTHQLAEGFITAHALGAVPIKGLGRPLDVYELAGAVKLRSRLQVAAARGLTPFIGRADELARLRQALERARAGHGQVVAVVGELGVGKSRLFYEFLRVHGTPDLLLLESASLSQGRTAAYHALTELLRGYFKIDSRDDLPGIREKVTGAVLALDERLRPVVPALLALLDALPPDSPFNGLSPPERRQSAIDAARTLLLCESLRQPVCLVFEDLHTVDHETLTFLDTLIPSLPGSAVLLLVNYRPDFSHGWGNKTAYTQIRIDPLVPAAAGELLEALLGRDPTLPALKRLLVDRTEGNPFFLEETVRTLVETRALVGEPSAYRLDRPLPSVQVPGTVQAALGARIDRLEPDVKRLLQSAAVIGKDVPFALLQALSGLPEDMVRQQVARLQAAEFLYQAHLFPDLELSFTHAMTHEVAYASLLHETRRALHGGIVDALEALHADRLAEHVERLGHHALRGERWEQAVRYLRQATGRALGNSAVREAVRYAEQTLAALGHLPEGPDAIQQAIDARLDLRSALLALQELDRAGECLTEAEGLAQRVADEPRLGRIAGFQAGHAYLSGHLSDAVRHAERAILIATRLDRQDLQVVPRIHLGQALHAKGRNGEAIGILTQNVEYLSGSLTRERFGMPGLPAVITRGWLTIAAAELGQFNRSIAYGREARLVSDALGGPFDLIHVNTSLAFVHLRQGDVPAAIPLAKLALDTCQTRGVPHMIAVAASHLGYAYALSGRLDEGLPLLEFAVRQSGEVGIRAGRAVWEVRLVEGYVLAGRVAEAIELGRRALERIGEAAEHGYEPYARHALGLAYAAGGSAGLEIAESHLRHALETARAIDLHPLRAHCHLGLARVQLTAGRLESAAAECARAADLYRRLGMSFWLPAVEEASRVCRPRAATGGPGFDTGE
jgi:class 3 adenylate cyclase/tetratricopeptide (TPR) repeat protein